MFNKDLDEMPDAVRLSAGKVAKVTGGMEQLEFSMDQTLLENDELYLGTIAIETDDYELERMIIASKDSRMWGCIVCSSKDTTSEEDRMFSDLQLLMMVDGIQT